ncbi:MAG: prepilin peptidase [Sporichthyaceae bacterium]
MATIVAVGVSLIVVQWAEPVLPLLLLVGGVGPVLARIDVVERRLPFTLTVPLFIAAVVLLAGTGAAMGEVAMGRAASAAAAWLMFYGAIHLFTRGRGMGLGDVVLAPTLGLVLGWIGWGAAVVGLAAGFLAAAVAAVSMLATGRSGRASLPFGPFMLAGAWLGVVFGPAIWAVYLAGGR